MSSPEARELFNSILNDSALYDAGRDLIRRGHALALLRLVERGADDYVGKFASRGTKARDMFSMKDLFECAALWAEAVLEAQNVA